jgi:FAD/FMN-containing dehydrogenase
MATSTMQMTDSGRTWLRERLRGGLIEPGGDGYDDARAVHSGMIDRHPAAIACCVDAADVIAAVDAARENGLLVSVRGGSHNVNGFGTNDDGLVIDLSRMHGVQVDPQRRTARVEGGATWGDLDHATHGFGLATTGGVVSTTGVGGLTLGGGIGHLTRAHGLSCDNLLSADVVTADGRFVTASRTEHPDLFWALRGGGGNFGVVTSFEFQLHPVGTVIGGPVFYEIGAAREALWFYRDFIGSAPDELGAFFGFHLAPPLPFLPADRHGQPMCVIVACYAGDHDTGRDVVQPLLDFGPPVGHHLGPIPYPALQSAFDPLYPPGLQHYWKAEFVKELTDQVIDVHMTYGPRVPHVSSAVHLYPIDGAAGRVAPGDTAFSYRDANFATVIAAMYPDPRDTPANVAWVREYHAALSAHSAGGAYVNFLMEEGQERIASTYRDNYPRLTEVKNAYDPGNLFRMNQNIKPQS